MQPAIMYEIARAKNEDEHRAADRRLTRRVEEVPPARDRSPSTPRLAYGICRAGT